MKVILNYREMVREMSPKLATLLEYLDSATGRIPLKELTAKLEEIDLEDDDVADFLHFNNNHYSRNLIKAGKHYHALALCWRNGQRSPIHDHGQSSCGVRVLRGVATETMFEFTHQGHVKATFSRELMTGQVCGSEDDDLHQVSNLQDGDAELVTLHIYSPPLLHMGTYSITDLKRGIEPMFLEFHDGAGI